jgi:ketosteroid isomerase-like protein
MNAQSNPTPVVDEAFMLRFFDAWTRKNIDDIVAMCTDDVVLESSFGPEVYGKRFVGHKALREGILRYWAMAKEPTMEDR